MNDTQNAATVSAVRDSSDMKAPARAAPVSGRPRILHAIASILPTALALMCIAALVGTGISTGWQMPKFSTLMGHEQAQESDWCEEHSVPESICVECKKHGQTPAAQWCREHGVHECPLCRPEVAQTTAPPTVTTADRDRAAKALAFTPRTPNNSKCKLHDRLIQVASDDVVDRLSIQVEPITRASVRETVTAPGETGYDPTRLARLSPRVRGSVWWVARQVGDRVRQGDVLALVDAAEVGKAKADFQQALVQLDLKRQSLSSLKASAGTVAGKTVQEAEAAVEEAQVHLLNTEQALANLGMPIRSEQIRGLGPDELARRLQFLAIPAELVQQLGSRTQSNNLLAVTAPFDGEIIERSAVAGEVAEPTKVLFVLADATRMWLTLRVRLEDADRILVGQKVEFEHEGHVGNDDGTVVWVSPAADERTRTVQVRVELPNAARLHHANTYGMARVVLRTEAQALVVPRSAVHWEGDCNVVFVRDKDFAKPGSDKVFHVRTVRPGAQDIAAGVPVTEVIAGLAPGEWIATVNSGIFRSELLKNNLGAG